MNRASLIFNPTAGRGGDARRFSLEHALAELRSNNIDAEIIDTQAPGSAGVQALHAADNGADLIFACGGDGTLHDIIQGLAHHPSATIGIIPLGSANALARHLGISFHPAEAIRQQLSFSPQAIPLGRVTCQTESGPQSRYFAVMTGAGPDGMLVYRMLATGKNLFGRSMYYLRAARLFLGSRFPSFHVRAALHDGSTLDRDAVSAMAIRVGDLGGLFSPLIRGSAPLDPTLQLTLTQPPHHLTLLAWFAASWTRTHRWNPYTQHVRATTFTCSASQERVHVQADGEWIGTTPMHVELVPNALRLLMPTTRSLS